jgi:hypothetical protein
MDSLKNVLGGRVPVEPPEINLIKNYSSNEFNAAVEVMVREREIIISSPNASLINSMRLRTSEIRKMCKTDKRLVFRVS